MARPRKSQANGSSKTASTAADLPLAQPDRTGPAFDDQTLYKLAEQRQLFQQADARIASMKKSGSSSTPLPEGAVKIPFSRGSDAESGSGSDDDDDDDEVPTLSPGAERVLEAMLWTVSLAMLHFTFDVLVQHQYGTEVLWGNIAQRAISAWAVFVLLFWALHGRQPNQTLIPGLPAHLQGRLRQLTFFAMSVVSGCCLIHVTNSKGYLATQKQAPPLGCLWIWAVIELDLPWATLSLMVASGFLYRGGYNVK